MFRGGHADAAQNRLHAWLAAANAVLLLVASTFFLAALALRPPEAGADGGADTPAILAGDRAVSASSAKCSTI